MSKRGNLSPERTKKREGRKDEREGGSHGEVKKKLGAEDDYVQLGGQRIPSLPPSGLKGGLCYVAPEDTNDTYDKKGPRLRWALDWAQP